MLQVKTVKPTLGRCRTVAGCFLKWMALKNADSILGTGDSVERRAEHFNTTAISPTATNHWCWTHRPEVPNKRLSAENVRVSAYTHFYKSVPRECYCYWNCTSLAACTRRRLLPTGIETMAEMEARTRTQDWGSLDALCRLVTAAPVRRGLAFQVAVLVWVCSGGVSIPAACTLWKDFEQGWMRSIVVHTE